MIIPSKIVILINWLNEKIKEIQRNKCLGWILLISSYIYPIILIYLSWEEIRVIKWDNLIGNFLLSFLLYSSSLLLQSINWTLVVNGSILIFLQDSEIFFQTLLMRRLPGGFWHWLGRINLYSANDLGNKNNIIKANLYEWSALILTGLTFYLFLTHYLAGTIIYVVVFLILLKMKTKTQKVAINNYFLVFVITISYLICWFFGGVIVQVLSTNLINSQGLTLITSCKTWALTGSVGSLTFFLPNGLFVREISFIALLSQILEFSEIILLALLVRLLFTFSDIIGSTGALLGIKLFRHIKSKNNY